MGTSELSALHNASQQLVVHNRDSGCPSKCGEAISAQALLSGVTPLQSWALYELTGSSSFSQHLGDPDFPCKCAQPAGSVILHKPCRGKRPLLISRSSAGIYYEPTLARAWLLKIAILLQNELHDKCVHYQAIITPSTVLKGTYAANLTFKRCLNTCVHSVCKQSAYNSKKNV